MEDIDESDWRTNEHREPLENVIKVTEVPYEVWACPLAGIDFL